MKVANLRTSEQNRRLHWLLNQLNIGVELKADYAYQYSKGRTNKTSELKFIECQQLIGDLENLLKKPRQGKSKHIEVFGDKQAKEHLDKLRKGVLKAIFRWYELQNREVTMNYVKATACRAAGVEQFNNISPSGLTRVYAEFCKKQNVIETKDDMHINTNLN